MKLTSELTTPGSMARQTTFHEGIPVLDLASSALSAHDCGAAPWWGAPRVRLSVEWRAMVAGLPSAQ